MLFFQCCHESSIICLISKTSVMTVASILPSHLMSHGKVLCRSKIGFDNTNALAYIIANIGKPIGADRKVLVHRNGVGIPRHFFIYIAPKRGISMSEKILSCFIDEAGDFGEYDYHSPYYIVSVVLHEQSHHILRQWSKTLKTNP